MSLSRCPSEVLTMICQDFCYHCNHDDAATAPNIILRDALDGQHQLAALSRCSRLLRDCAQPVLHHAYWTHRAPLTSLHRQAKSLACFLRTLQAQPWLRGKVECLVLMNPIPLHDRRGRLLREVDDNQQAVLALCSGNVKQLAWDLNGRWRCWDNDWTQPLPKLELLVFAGSVGYLMPSYDCIETSSLVRNAPNLQTLLLPDCGSPDGDDDWGFLNINNPTGQAVSELNNTAWDIRLQFLKKLSLNGVCIFNLRQILRGCKSLETLEYFGHCLEEDEWDPSEHLEPVRKTLRHLVHSVPSYSTNNCDWSSLDLAVLETDWEQLFDFDMSTEASQLKYTMEMRSLRGGRGGHSSKIPDEEVLRELREEDLWAEFVPRLPASLKRLRVGGIRHWAWVLQHAFVLAREAPSRFPHLAEVCLEGVRDSRGIGEEYHGHIRKTLAAVGISVVIRLQSPCRCAAGDRGVLPPRPLLLEGVVGDDCESGQGCWEVL